VNEGRVITEFRFNSARGKALSGFNTVESSRDFYPPRRKGREGEGWALP
jgi:hypothetical protein